MSTYAIQYTNAEIDELEAASFRVSKQDPFVYFRDKSDANVFVVRADSIQSISRKSPR